MNHDQKEKSERKWIAWTTNKAAINPDRAWFVSGPENRYMDRSCGFSEDDAHLIAAAPDLLAALEQMCRRGHDHECASLMYAQADCDCGVGVAAIAKAKGGQP